MIKISCPVEWSDSIGNYDGSEHYNELTIMLST